MGARARPASARDKGDVGARDREEAMEKIKKKIKNGGSHVLEGGMEGLQE
jgi:hypothetical protein